MNKSLRLVATLLRLRLTRRMAEPASFWAAFFVDTTVFLLQAAVFSVIYLNVDEINGWNRAQTVFFVGTFTLIDALYMSFYFFGILGIPETIRSGRLELYLAKPVDPLVHLSFEKADPGSLFLILPALALIVGSAAALGISPRLPSIAAYCGAVALMLILMYDLMVLFRTCAFWLGRTGGLQEAEGALVEFGFRLPGKALRGPWKVLFRCILPYGLIASFPTEAFFGEAGGGAWAAALCVTIVFTALSRLAWRAGLRRYTGTGS